MGVKLVSNIKEGTKIEVTRDCKHSLLYIMSLYYSHGTQSCTQEIYSNQYLFRIWLHQSTLHMAGPGTLGTLYRMIPLQTTESSSEVPTDKGTLQRLCTDDFSENSLITEWFIIHITRRWPLPIKHMLMRLQMTLHTVQLIAYCSPPCELYSSYQQSCKIGNQDGRLGRNSLAVDVVLSSLLSVVTEYSRKGGGEAYTHNREYVLRNPQCGTKVGEGNRWNTRYCQDLRCSPSASKWLALAN
jgi:hypothetical protein